MFLFFKHQKMRLFLSLVLVIFMFSGCVSLKKKFVRQKKKDQNNAIEPILDPIEYALKVVTSEQRYKKHFALFRVWQRDFLNEMKENFSEKRKKYLLTTTITELQEMKKYLIEEKQLPLESLIIACQEQLAKLNVNRGLRSDSKITRESRRVLNQILNDFNPKLMGVYYN